MGEFNNDVFRGMVEQLNINIKTTAAESPWYNGIEKHNGIKLYHCVFLLFHWTKVIWEYDGRNFIGS